ncbi:MAG: hypothetical protein WC119_00565 [Synergistaceae bacterium]
MKIKKAKDIVVGDWVSRSKDKITIFKKVDFVHIALVDGVYMEITLLNSPSRLGSVTHMLHQDDLILVADESEIPS